MAMRIYRRLSGLFRRPASGARMGWSAGQNGMTVEEEKIERLVSWARGGSAPPLVVELRISNRCNLKCIYCYQRDLPQKKELSKAELASLVKDAAGLGVRSWIISGDGEPAYDLDRLISLLSDIKRFGMDGALTTNATLFNKASIRSLVDMGWNHITVSIDGADAAVHDFMRGQAGAFRRIMENLSYLNEVKREKSASLPTLGFQVVIHKKNYLQLVGLVELAAKMGVENISFQPLIVHSGNMSDYRLDSNALGEFQQEIGKVHDASERLDIKTNILGYRDEGLISNSNNMDVNISANSAVGAGVGNPPAGTLGNDGTRNTAHWFLGLPCFEPWYMVAVRADGEAGSCFNFQDSGENIRSKRLGEIWAGESFNSVRKALKSGKIFKYCSTCCALNLLSNSELKAKLSKQLEADR